MSWDAEIDKLLNQTEGEVFEKATLDAIWKLMNKQIITSLDFPISTGKEGTVFRIKCKSGYAAMKVYRINTATFRSLSKHIQYSSLKTSKHDKRSIIFSWALKEFTNLEKLYNAGLPVPKPIAREGNIIIMEYIGTETEPAPLLKDAKIKNYQKVFSYLQAYLKDMYQKAKLVHADFSAYNVMMRNNMPVIIDVGQAVETRHPMADLFLDRDIKNITTFFKKYVVEIDEKKLKKYVIEGKIK